MSPSTPETPLDWRDHVKAVLVGLHIVLVLLLATPASGDLMNRKAWSQPSVQEEFAVWGDRVGLEVEEVDALLWSVVQGYDKTRTAVLGPTALPYARWFGTGQGWQLFAAPERHPARLEIFVEEPVASRLKWRKIYRARSDEYTWMRAFFDQDRVRTISYLYTWPQFRKRGLTKRLADFLEPRIRADFPEAVRFRLRFVRGATPRPEQVLAGETIPTRHEGVLTRRLH